LLRYNGKRRKLKSEGKKKEKHQVQHGRQGNDFFKDGLWCTERKLTLLNETRRCKLQTLFLLPSLSTKSDFKGSNAFKFPPTELPLLIKLFIFTNPFWILTSEKNYGR
jgi:hypothetical protein